MQFLRHHQRPYGEIWQRAHAGNAGVRERHDGDRHRRLHDGTAPSHEPTAGGVRAVGPGTDFR